MLSLLTPRASRTRSSSSSSAEPPDHTSLNQYLRTLHDLFPTCSPSDLRHLLLTTSPDSRLHVCAERLLHTAKPDTPATLPPHTLFRTASYQTSVRRTLQSECKGLPKSTIAGVLAEVNYSYTHARPILQRIAERSWRVSIRSFFSRTRSQGSTTGDLELDAELLELARPDRDRQSAADETVAKALNEAEYEVLIDCECCFEGYTLEDMVVCSAAAGHTLCVSCVRAAVNEAVFGTAARSLIPERATVRCLAAVDGAECDGYIPPLALDSALPQDVNSALQTRIAQENLQSSGLTLVTCPFCSYAEARDPPAPPRYPEWSPKVLGSVFTTMVLVILLQSPWAFLMLAWAALPFIPSTRRPRRVQEPKPMPFACRAESCGRISCTTCHAVFEPYHECSTSAATSLRLFIERAQAEAVKRTCPQCGVSFVKDSGCNMIVCKCGYVMCYMCREGIGKERYEHFCGHFREQPGESCGVCGKCELYREVGEEVERKAAGEKAEREWRELHEGGSGSRTRGTAWRALKVVFESGGVTGFINSGFD